MTRLVPLLVLTSLLVTVPAARPGTQDGRLFNLIPRPRLQELSLDDVESMLDVLTDLMEERTLPSGEKGLVSRLVAPTLSADSELCREHTQIYWNLLM